MCLSTAKYFIIYILKCILIFFLSSNSLGSCCSKQQYCQVVLGVHVAGRTSRGVVAGDALPGE